jgi:isopentenyl-diphosphate Delta-isomerase
MEIESRKRKHLEVCLSEEVEYTTVSTGFQNYRLRYQALPEMALDEVDLSTVFLGKQLRAPFLIGAMTGGEAFGATINRNLAEAAQRLGLGMMLGSQRIMLEQPHTAKSFQVRGLAPDILLVGNLGLTQFNRGYDHTHILRAIQSVAANAIALHINPLQEALQPGGDTDFSGLIAKLGALLPQVPFPVILKEVGHGIGLEVAQQIATLPFAALDVAGAGGTSWAKVEQWVHYGKIQNPDLVELGIPTAQALQECVSCINQPLIASGGIRSGSDAAKALALGAQMVALARPLLKPALQSADAVVTWIEHFLQELRLALFATGSKTPKALLGKIEKLKAP